MFQLQSMRTCLLVATTVTCLAPATSLAQDFSDRDSREISSYALTEAGLAKYTQATRNLEATAQKASSSCDDEDGENTESLDAAVARLDAMRGAKAAIKSAGMTTREYLVFGWSVFQTGMAAWAVSQPGGKLPPGVSKANVDFYRSHEAALSKLGKSDGDCDDTDGRDEPAQDE